MVVITYLMVILRASNGGNDNGNTDISNGSHKGLLAFSISSLHLHTAYYTTTMH